MVSITDDAVMIDILLELGYTRICHTCGGSAVIRLPENIRLFGLIPIKGYISCPCCSDEIRPGCHLYFSQN